MQLGLRHGAQPAASQAEQEDLPLLYEHPHTFIGFKPRLAVARPRHQTSVQVTVPQPSTKPDSVSPFTTAATPSGVPV